MTNFTEIDSVELRFPQKTGICGQSIVNRGLTLSHSEFQAIHMETHFCAENFNEKDENKFSL